MFVCFVNIGQRLLSLANDFKCHCKINAFQVRRLKQKRKGNQCKSVKWIDTMMPH